MHIRTASLADAAALAAVEAACFPPAEAATAAEITDRLAYYADHFWLLEEDDGTLVSFVDGMTTDEPTLRDEMYENAALHDEDGTWQMIFGVNTLPAYRRRGCAGAVLERVIADARAQGRRGCVLTCKDKLVHYYEKFGFVNEGVSQSTHGGVVWRELSHPWGRRTGGRTCCQRPRRRWGRSSGREPLPQPRRHRPYGVCWPPARRSWP